MYIYMYRNGHARFLSSPVALSWCTRIGARELSSRTAHVSCGIYKGLRLKEETKEHLVARMQSSLQHEDQIKLSCALPGFVCRL